ncbi:MAG: anthranilate synthase component I family protein [Ignavibacteria bacterium]|nr:anthranilate synthase component I family protein [Ignavibacteria bacterium]
MQKEEFLRLAENYNLIPLYSIITADMVTPVLAYIKIREKGKASFLYESVEGNAQMARFSFIARDPEVLFFSNGLNLRICTAEKDEALEGDLFRCLRDVLQKYHPAPCPDLPDFSGGIVGYIGYENICTIEPTVTKAEKSLGGYDSILGLYKSIVAFDHYRHQIILINNVFIEEGTDPEVAYDNAQLKIQELKKLLRNGTSYQESFAISGEISNSVNDSDFFDMVEKAKRHIIEGDIFQIVLSKRFSSSYKGDIFNVYRALRIINPSPYMYCLEYPGEFTIIGTSPEDLVKVKNGKAQLLPIAGTRARGKSEEQDLALETNLLADEKELAEHTMLVDLGRNDLGRVCQYGTVKVTELMKIQRYSHVMHIVSKVEGVLRADKDLIDTFRSCFPAGTVTGAPKIRAMQLIREFEGFQRNVYAGAVGYFDFSGNMDFCIAIRTLFANKDMLHWQAGAGIVADSQPNLELKEIHNKAAAMVQALQYAEVIDENPGN